MLTVTDILTVLSFEFTSERFKVYVTCISVYTAKNLNIN
jgi:hypothetical protein